MVSEASHGGGNLISHDSSRPSTLPSHSSDEWNRALCTRASLYAVRHRHAGGALALPEENEGAICISPIVLSLSYWFPVTRARSLKKQALLQLNSNQQSDFSITIIPLATPAINSCDAAPHIENKTGLDIGWRVAMALFAWCRTALELWDGGSRPTPQPPSSLSGLIQ